MGASTPGDLTQLLLAWRQGDQTALNRLVPMVYRELHRLAHRALRAQPLEQSLQTTALINEAYLKLTNAAAVPWQDRIHFLAICAQVMRRILVDTARSRGSLKRGRGGRPIQFDEALHVGAEAHPDLVRLDDALRQLEQIDPRKVKAIELRFFGGFSIEEAAEVIGVSRETVLRDWRLARAWLKSALAKVEPHG
jgi:RNA polymerase sigma-70 factor (ECF subfamily)